MTQSKPISSSSTSKPSSDQINVSRIKKTIWPFTFIVTIALPVSLAVLVYQLDSFDPVEYPIHELTHKEPVVVPRRRNGHMLQGAEKIGVGKLLAPEDFAYDVKLGVIYTGCHDGWIKRVKVTESASDSAVEDWVNTGGRPLGLVQGNHGELIIADADKGLLNATGAGEIHLLTDEAEGVKLKFTDGVDIAEDGIIYFTDASYKYSLHEFIWDILEGGAYGRLLSYDPSTKETRVLVRDLHFANGVSLSPDQKSVIFCETALRCCKKFYIKGENKGKVEMFIRNMVGMPDNIRYDRQGSYWIALSTGKTYSWDVALRYPFIRKILGIMVKSIGRPNMEKNGGVLVVDLEGKPIAHYYDHDASMMSTGMKIGDHLYCGSVVNPYIIRLNLTQHPAVES